MHPLSFPGRFLSLMVHDFAARRHVRVCDVTILASEVREAAEAVASVRQTTNIVSEVDKTTNFMAETSVFTRDCQKIQSDPDIFTDECPGESEV